MSPVHVTLSPPPPRWRPSFSSKVDPDVANAINRLYDLVYQLGDQVQLLAQYLNKNP